MLELRETSHGHELCLHRPEFVPAVVHGSSTRAEFVRVDGVAIEERGFSPDRVVAGLLRPQWEAVKQFDETEDAPLGLNEPPVLVLALERPRLAALDANASNARGGVDEIDDRPVVDAHKQREPNAVPRASVVPRSTGDVEASLAIDKAGQPVTKGGIYV